MFDNLTDFLSRLIDDGEIRRITAEVDPVCELAAVTDAVCKSPGGGPALFFENVRGSTFSAVSNLLGSSRRMCLALRCESFDELAERFARLMQPHTPDGWMETLKRVPELTQLATLSPKLIKTAICQQVVKMGADVDLGEFPLPQCWPGESARVITAGQVLTRDPARKQLRVARLPVVVRDQASVFVLWNSHHDWARFYEEYRLRKQPMPIAIVLGGDPAHLYAASAPLPQHTDPFLFAGFVRGKHLELVRCRSIDLEVPADAEVVLEGRIEPDGERELCGPIAAPTGFYTEAAEWPVVPLTAVTHRADPVFPITVWSRPPSESDWLGRACERLLVPLVRQFVPELADLHQPRCGAFRNLLFASVHKRFPQQARQVMSALWSFGALAASKIVVVVDADVNLHDEAQVWHAVGSHVHPGRDVVFCEGPTHAEDHAAPIAGVGHKLGFDATRKLPEEGHPRTWPAALQMPPEILELIRTRWSEYGLDVRTPIEPRL